LAGACDALTGWLLLTVPVCTLEWMRIPQVPAEPIWLRWIGIFVGAVGMAYLYPFFLDPERRDRRLATVLEVTTGVRLAVGTFVVWAVLSEALPAPWLVVAATDLGLAAIQLWMILSGALSEKESDESR
jgi:hypothetical protein